MRIHQRLEKNTNLDYQRNNPQKQKKHKQEN